MKRLIRSIRRRLRHLFNAETVTINGVVLNSKKGVLPDDVRDMLFRERYEDTERNVLVKILRPGSRVVEIGAGIGFVSLLSAKLCGSDNVHSYEANPELRSLIEGNFRLNNLSPMLTMKAVTTDGRDLTFNIAENIISSSAFDRNTPTRLVTVSSVPLANVLAEHKPDTVIMDVEGAEYELLMNSDLPGVTDLLIELHPHIIGDKKVNEIKSKLTSLRFQETVSDRKTFHFRRRHAARPIVDNSA